jgi:inosine-uridine nucleoside N-ribohydrolase
VAWLLDSTLFRTERCHLRIETNGDATGQTVWEPALVAARPVCQVCMEVDVPRLLALIEQCLRAL